MLRRLFPALFCSVIIIGKIHAQEVIVAREKKPESLRQPPESPQQTVQPSEKLPSETPAPKPRKSKPREKKSISGALTLEQMRAAGARAGGGLDESASQPTKAREAEVEIAPLRNPTAPETHRPVKRQMPVEQRGPSPATKPRGPGLEGIGAIRPTMIESGREPPSPSPSGR
jgi:hypothetical protein